MQTLGIEQYRDRYPSQLSGGQQHRVALASMLAINPDILLLDEPLSNLDARLRLEMRAELKRIHSEFGTTIVFVTHDQWEAMTLATRIAVMHDGRLQQVGSPDDIYARPANRFVAEFVGNPPINIIELNQGDPDGLTEIVSPYLASLQVPSTASIGLRPEGIEIGRVPASDETLIGGRAKVSGILPTGGSWIVELDVSGQTLFATMSTAPEIQIGQIVDFHAAPLAVHAFDAHGNRIDCGSHRDLAHPQNQPIKAQGGK
jgi:iron(III) transport system ATP-binding protein